MTLSLWRPSEQKQKRGSHFELKSAENNASNLLLMRHFLLIMDGMIYVSDRKCLSLIRLIL